LPTSGLPDLDRDQWISYEDRAAVSSTGTGRSGSRNPTAVHIGRTDNQQLSICPAAPEHPHAELMQ